MKLISPVKVGLRYPNYEFSLDGQIISNPIRLMCVIWNQ